MTVHVLTITPGVPSQRQRCTLDGREYTLDLRWSQRESRWYLDLRDQAGTLLVGSIKVVVGWRLLYRFRTVTGLPPGDLFAIDGRVVPADPALDELGDVVQLAYLDAEELAA